MPNPNKPGDNDTLLDSLTNLNDLTPEQLTRLVQLGESAKVAAATRLKGSGILSSAYRTPAIISSDSSEFAELVEVLGLEDGYSHARGTQKDFGLAKANEIPDFGAVLETFTPEMLQAAKDFQKPELVLKTKGRAFNDLVSAMDAHKTMPDQKDVYVNDLFSQHANQKLERWSAHIIEAPTDVTVQDFDNLDLTLGNRIERFAEYKKANGINGMDRMKYAHLMMQRLQSGEPIDQEFWTMFDEDPALSDTHVPVAYWDRIYHEVGFGWGCPGDQNDDDRLRRSVGGDVAA